MAMCRAASRAIHLRVLSNLSLFIAAGASRCSSGDSCWSTSLLDSQVGYTAHHQVQDDVLHLKLEANTTGWLGFGIADPNSGHMKGSDLLTVSVVNGVAKAEDRYAPFAASTYTANGGIGYEGLWAYEDVRNDWTIISGEERSGRTIVYVTRALRTSDAQDRIIRVGLNKIVWARGASDVVGHHGVNRGVTQIVFFGQHTLTPFPAYDGMWEKKIGNFTILPATTRYICKSFKFDTTEGDKHIVAIRPINVKKYHHHALLHICVDNGYFQRHEDARVCTGDNQVGGQGLSPLGAFESGCAGQVWVWGAGAGDFILPEEAGFRVGSGTNQISHVIFEIHYDNPAHDLGVIDDFGFQVFWTRKLRPHDAGQITLGDPTVTFWIRGNLPAGKRKLHRQASCPSECTKNFKEPIHVFAQLLHMHHYGEKIYTEHYSADGDFVSIPNRIDFWDNGFQPVHEDRQFTIRPGDSLQTHCYYNTLGTKRDVRWGLGTGEEMCMDFLFYYPAQYRGIADSGEPLPFAFCAQRVEKVSFFKLDLTVCGSLSQKGTHKLMGLLDVPNAVFQGGQTEMNASYYEDPLTFGAETSSRTTRDSSGTADARNVRTSAILFWSACVSFLCTNA